MNSRGFSTLEILIALFLISLLGTSFYVFYSNVVVDTQGLLRMGEEIEKILVYYEQINCNPSIPAGLPNKNPYGFDYTVSCGNKYLTVVTTQVPSNVKKVILPAKSKIFCYINANNVVCFKLWGMADDGGYEKNRLYGENI